MCNCLEKLKECDFVAKCGCLDDEVTITKKNLLLAGIAMMMTGVVIGMLAAMKRQPSMQPEGKKKHCCEGKKKHCCFRKRLM